MFKQFASIRASSSEENQVGAVESGNSSLLNSFAVSKKESKMRDRLNDETGKTNIMYVSLTDFDGRTKKSIFETLAAKRGQRFASPLALEKIPVLDLQGNKVEFCLANVIKDIPMKAKNKVTGAKVIHNWISVYELIVLFNGSNSVIGQFGPVKITLEDRRKIHNSVVKHATVMDNMSSALYFSLEYGVHVVDFHHIFLCIERMAAVHIDGIFWASVRIEMSLKTSKECITGALIPVMGFLEISPTALVKHKHNPNSVDLMLTDENISKLIELKKAGLIRDLSQPEAVQVAGDFAGSEAGSEESFVDRPILQSFIDEQRKKDRVETGKARFSEENQSFYIPGRTPEEKSVKKGLQPKTEYDPRPIDEWTDLAYVIDQLFPGQLKVEGWETTMSSIKGLDKLMKNASEDVKGYQIFYDLSETEGNKIFRYMPGDEDDIEYRSIKLSEFYANFKTNAFDRED